MIELSRVTPVVVTRGDVDLTRVLAPLGAAGLPEPVVWDNSMAQVDLGVFGRYAALTALQTPVAFVIDDDVELTTGAVLAIVGSYEPGRLVANMPRSRWNDYPDSTLVGWGAVFDRDLPLLAFGRYVSGSSGFDEGVIDLLLASVCHPDELLRDRDLVFSAFLRDCDLVFSALTPRTVIDVGFAHLPWAEGPDRMFRQPGHAEARRRILAEARKLRTWPDDDRRHHHP